MMAKTNLKRGNTGAWVEKRESSPRISVKSCVYRPRAGHVETVWSVGDASKRLARGTIEDRMDSENAGIVFLD